MSGSADDLEPGEALEPTHRRFDCTGDDPIVVAEAAEAARTAIENGECIVLPTDTVYGIAADAFSADAVQRLLDAKLRGRDMPPPVLIAERSLIRALATEVPDAATELVERHWPGPLTVILKRQPSLKMDLGDTEGTVALRVPDHALAREVLRSTGPMAVSSANLSGRPAATTVDQAVEQLGDSVAVYLDGGPVGGATGAPSTIVDFTQSGHGQVLRRGALSVAVLRETCPDLEDLAEPEPEPSPSPSRSNPSSKRTRPATAVVGQHEPDTDELRITHADVDPYQPDLFGGDDEAELAERRTGRSEDA